jgi:hypothetical protein
MQANQQGTFYKSITIERDGESFSNTILKSEFLKKSENYSCLVQSFLTNITPQLNTSEEIAFQVFVRGTAGDLVENVTFPAHWRLADTQFTPTPYYSAIEFLRQMSQFFHKFGFLVKKLGAGEIDGELGAQGRANGYPFFETHFDGTDNDEGDPYNGGWGDFQDNCRMISCKLKSDGTVRIEVTAEFANNFYVVVGPDTQRLLGLDPTLYVLLDDNGEYSTTADFITGLGQFEDEVDNEVLQGNFFESRNALHSLDERVSIDVICTLPLANKVFAKNGKEEHEYILARFPINDYNRFETTLESTPESVTDNVIVREDINVGLEDLTRKSPSSSSVFLLPGTIQQLNVQLNTRYFVDGTVISSPSKMGDGFWKLKLLFGKKV